MHFKNVLFIVVFTVCARGGIGPISVQPGDQPLIMRKVPALDCRAVRGFVGAPVDGSVESASWDGKTWEYPMRGAGAGVAYGYRNADGLHITLADDEGFNAIVVRGGAKANVVGDARRYDDPESGRLTGKLNGAGISFDELIKTRHVSFFNVRDGLLADVLFFRTAPGVLDHAEPLVETCDEERSLTAIGVECEVERGGEFTVIVHDPLNPRLALHSADYVAAGAGRARLICDFPDQVIPAGVKLSVSVQGAAKNIQLTQYAVAREKAIPQALAYRRFILHALYVPMSEARPWNVWNNPDDDEKYLSAPADTGDELQDRLRPWVREIVTTLKQRQALDPEGNDQIVRQIHQWMYRKILTKAPGGMPVFATKYDRIDGVPEWASLAHQGWMQAREVPRWWIENRMTPNGEFGGEIGDDTDMYQNYAPFPMLERDGIGGMVLDAGARMAELAEGETLDGGINKRSIDPLHAYEEGLNHEALMAYWNYGDPIYFERCMAAARSIEPLTMITGKGHRHFRSNSVGIDEARSPHSVKPEREHGSHCLMWHPAFIVAWYNRNPLTVQWLTQWADGWLDHMKTGDEGNAITLPEDVTSKSDPLTFQGEWGMTGSCFAFLADLTGDPRFVRPYVNYFAREKKHTGFHFAELAQMGMTSAAITDPPWNAVLHATGDKQPLVDALKKDIEELQRFKYMYTEVECFTDRVFLYPIINPSIAYTGGYTTRNKLNLTYAVSWNGFGTDYAALVTAATGEHLKVLLCNLSDRPISGTARMWRLQPGEYDLSFGSDANGDDNMDHADRHETLSVTRGDEIALNLPPKVVHVLELKQTRKAAPNFQCADLALARRELEMKDGRIRGVVHNIGGADVNDVVVTLLAGGKSVQTKHLGALAAPLDLKSSAVAFELDGNGDAIVLSGAALEIFMGNNRVAIGR